MSRFRATSEQLEQLLDLTSGHPVANALKRDLGSRLTRGGHHEPSSLGPGQLEAVRVVLSQGNRARHLQTRDSGLHTIVRHALDTLTPPTGLEVEVLFGGVVDGPEHSPVVL